MMKKPLLTVAVGLLATPAFALNILVSNDDGLTSNVKALYDALKSAGHDVSVSVPCTGQSMRGGGAVMYSSGATLSAANDAALTKNQGCHNGALKIADMSRITEKPVGQFNKEGYTGGDWNYVHGTPVMATMYGVDVLAQARWGQAPDLVLSGPNEGYNIGTITLISGTVGNAQFAATRGIPSIALSGVEETADNDTLAHADSALIAQLTLKLLAKLQAQPSAQSGGRLLPEGMALNVNFPSKLSADMPLTFAKLGSWNVYRLRFNNYESTGQGHKYYGLGGDFIKDGPTEAQKEDEPWLVARNGQVTVSAMQVAFEARPAAQEWLRLRLSGQ